MPFGILNNLLKDEPYTSGIPSHPLAGIPEGSVSSDCFALGNRSLFCVLLPCDSIFERTLAIFINFRNIENQVLWFRLRLLCCADPKV
jgi:hypothetical protein